MCDWSLTTVKSRPAKVGDTLTTRDFGTGTRGFAAAEDCEMAVCVLPGTELAFADGISGYGASLMSAFSLKSEYRTAIFRQINRGVERAHHDALELPDGEIMLLNALSVGQFATVLQLPAAPKTQADADEQKRVAFAG
jgi:hypothetical protein